MRPIHRYIDEVLEKERKTDVVGTMCGLVTKPKKHSETLPSSAVDCHRARQTLQRANQTSKQPALSQSGYLTRLVRLWLVRYEINGDFAVLVGTH